MKNILLLLSMITLVLSGSSCQRQIQDKKSIKQENKVYSFLESCEKDLSKAAQIISRKKLISVLNHLNRMNSGGDYYYPLERDSITQMLNQLSTYPYSECILTTKKGRIIYTMYNNEILGQSIYRLLASPFNDLMEETLNDNPSISDSIRFTTKNSKTDIFFSYPVKDSENNIEGVIIASIPVMALSEILPKNSRIVNSSGVYLFHPDPNKRYKADTDFKKGYKNYILSTKDGKFLYENMTYKNLNWFLITAIQR